MTRKRFIKLQMAAGCDRNTAAAIAQRVQASGMSYAESLDKWATARGFVAGLANPLAPVVEAVTTWIKAVAAGYEAFSKALEGAPENGA